MTDRLAPLRARIEAELARRDWSARRASLAAGLGPSTLNNFLAGQTRLGPQACVKLARLFGWDEDEVLALAGHRSPPPPATLGQVLATVQRLDWPDDLRAAVRDLLVALDRHAHPVPEEGRLRDAAERAFARILAAPPAAYTPGAPLSAAEQQQVLRAAFAVALAEELGRLG